MNVSPMLGIYLVEHAPIYVRRKIAWFPEKKRTRPHRCVLSDQTRANLLSGPEISRPLVQRERSPTAGHLFGRTRADLSAAPGCLVPP